LSYLFSRRRFLQGTTAGGIGLLTGLQGMDQWLRDTPFLQDGLYDISKQLVALWGQSLLNLQLLGAAAKDDYGGIYCPTNKLVHGRVGDTIYPFLKLARQTNDQRYVDGAVLLYRWMERRVSQEDGSWLNEPVKGAWKGTTIFSIIALCDALHHHGDLLDEPFKQEVRTRLRKAGDYVYNNFSIDYGNINYPISAAYGLTLLGEQLDVPQYKAKGREFAHLALSHFTKKDGFLYGEGDAYQASAKGCYAIDLGYNVEESLPNLALYGLLTRDEEILQAVTHFLQTHMELMLPDGGWDNSWGTRNYKWTYWGSRTSDGCQPAYALLADRDPRFYKVALKNTELLQQCTHEGLLYGGPHYVSHKVPPSVHHTFCHIKALTTILDHAPVVPVTPVSKLVLPREEAYGSRLLADIQTWLISKGRYRATVTGYDKEYKKTKNGHATGGALTMLWHEATGPLITASMNEYQLIEAGNMQVDTDPLSICLTPRIELNTGDDAYMNICDLTADIQVGEVRDTTMVTTRSKLVNKDQQSPSTGVVNCKVQYRFAPNKFRCRFSYEGPVGNNNVRVVFPLISHSGEVVKNIDARTLTVDKGNVVVKLTSNRDILLLPTSNGRVFNFVPGLEAIPLTFEGEEVNVELEVLEK
jgi:hypothetical protein